MFFTTGNVLFYGPFCLICRHRFRVSKHLIRFCPNLKPRG